MFLGDWSAKGQERQLWENSKFLLMSLKLIMEKTESSHCKVFASAVCKINKFFHHQSKPLHAENTTYDTLCKGPVRGHVKLKATDQWGEKHWYTLSVCLLIAGAKSFITNTRMSVISLTQTEDVLQSRPSSLMNGNSWCQLRWFTFKPLIIIIKETQCGRGWYEQSKGLNHETFNA